MAFTEKQQKFLDALFGEAEGNFQKAKRIAGYSNTNNDWLSEELQKAVLDKANKYLAMHAPQAVNELIAVMTDPTELGSEKKLNAAKEVLDRTGLTKVERMQVNSDKPIGIFILPPKDPN